MDARSYPTSECDIVISTGLGEFLDDVQLATLYRNIYGALAPGGVFFTSATELDPRSENLLRAMELDTNYRDRAALEGCFGVSGNDWKTLEFRVDPSGLQTFVRAEKLGSPGT